MDDRAEVEVLEPLEDRVEVRPAEVDADAVRRRGIGAEAVDGLRDPVAAVAGDGEVDVQVVGEPDERTVRSETQVGAEVAGKRSGDDARRRMVGGPGAGIA